MEQEGRLGPGMGEKGAGSGGIGGRLRARMGGTRGG
jgi:hypothetical protein